MWYYDGHHIGGMHWFWRILWVLFIFWIFATSYAIPGQRKKKDTPLDILKKRYAAGELTMEEFNEKKQLIQE